MICFVLFGLLLYVPVKSYVHVETVSSPNHIFFLGILDQAVNQYFVHILSLVTGNNPYSISGREENDSRKDFIISLLDSMGLGRDRTHDPWTCSQTRHRMCYAVRYRLLYEI